MTALQIRLALLAWKLVGAYLRRQQANLTAEQKAEIQTEMAKPPDEQWWNKAKGDGS